LSSQTNRTTGRGRISLRRLLIGSSALPATALATMLVLPHHASAALVSYTFTNDASITFADGNVEDVSGSFDFDTVGGLISSPDITLTGPAPEADSYDTNDFYAVSVAGPAVCGNDASGIPTFCMWFATLLGGSTSDLVTSPLGGGIGYFPTDPGINVIETAVAGGVTESAPVPEPSTLALLAGAIGLLSRRRRMTRRHRA
jgi:hypothetical protein